LKLASKDRGQLVVELRTRLLGNLAENSKIIELLEILDPDNMHTLPLQEQADEVARTPDTKVSDSTSTPKPRKKQKRTRVKEKTLQAVETMAAGTTFTAKELAAGLKVNEKTLSDNLLKLVEQGLLTSMQKRDGSRRYIEYTRVQQEIGEQEKMTLGTDSSQTDGQSEVNEEELVHQTNLI